MNIFDPDRNKLDAMLKQAYRARDNAQAGAHLCDRVMMRVRQAGPSGSGERDVAGLEELAWRLAPVSCVLTVALIFLLVTLGSVSADPLQSFFSSTEEAVMAQVLGV